MMYSCSLTFMMYILCQHKEHPIHTTKINDDCKLVNLIELSKTVFLCAVIKLKQLTMYLIKLIFAI